MWMTETCKIRRAPTEERLVIVGTQFKREDQNLSPKT